MADSDVLENNQDQENNQGQEQRPLMNTPESPAEQKDRDMRHMFFILMLGSIVFGAAIGFLTMGEVGLEEEVHNSDGTDSTVATNLGFLYVFSIVVGLLACVGLLAAYMRYSENKASATRMDPYTNVSTSNTGAPVIHSNMDSNNVKLNENHDAKTVELNVATRSRSNSQT